jgi:hypothetical protein
MAFGAFGARVIALVLAMQILAMGSCFTVTLALGVDICARSQDGMHMRVFACTNTLSRWQCIYACSHAYTAYHATCIYYQQHKKSLCTKCCTSKYVIEVVATSLCRDSAFDPLPDWSFYTDEQMDALEVRSHAFASFVFECVCLPVVATWPCRIACNGVMNPTIHALR